ncbi:MAG: hypothetical protein RAK22_01240 [Nanoarchaeota archaeon]|nr:hypothetical protein [Nanoarchaeota archaeon]
MEQQVDLVKSIIELRESLKIFEQKLLQLKDSISVVDQNNIERYNETKENIQNLFKLFDENRSKILEIEDQLERMSREMEQFARDKDVKIIEKYLSFIDPSRFLSKEDVIKIVDDYLNEKKWG